jgi:hypothetical protein
MPQMLTLLYILLRRCRGCFPSRRITAVLGLGRYSRIDKICGTCHRCLVTFIMSDELGLLRMNLALQSF